MSEKPILFISHSSKDGHIANVLKEQLEAVLNIEVWHTSEPDSIKAGSKWFLEIVQRLDKAKALFVLCSYNSRYSQWVHWEIGYFYKRGQLENETLPIYVATIAGEKPFPTVEENQAKSLNDVNEASFLLESIGNHFNFNLPKYSYQKAVEEILRVAPVHISDESAKEKLRDFLKSYKTGTWIDYGELDAMLQIPSGSSKNYLNLLIQEDNLNLKIDKENEKGVRYYAEMRLIDAPDGWDDPLGNY
jgi:hypothetical protein